MSRGLVGMARAGSSIRDVAADVAVRRVLDVEGYLDLFDPLPVLGELSQEARRQVVTVLLGYMGLYDAVMGMNGRRMEGLERQSVSRAAGHLREESVGDRCARVRWYLQQMELGHYGLLSPDAEGMVGMDLAVRKEDGAWHLLAYWRPGDTEEGTVELARAEWGGQAA